MKQQVRGRQIPQSDCALPKRPLWLIALLLVMPAYPQSAGPEFPNPGNAHMSSDAANTAKQFNVGMEIDYEKSSNPNLTGLQQFVTAYRSVLPYDSTGNNYAARLTIDLGNDDLFLQPLSAYATTHWLTTSSPVVDYANAWSPRRRLPFPLWRMAGQHVDGITGVPPLAPAKLSGSLWLIAGQPNCAAFSSSDQKAGANFVETIPPKGQGQGTGCTFPPTTCEGGMGVAATTFNIPIPMPTLRQEEYKTTSMSSCGDFEIGCHR